MKKIASSIIISCLAVASGSVYAQSSNGKILGMSGAGVASADFESGGILNPALTANFTEADDFNINFNAGALVSDEDEFVDSANAIKDIMDAIDGQDPTTIIAELENLKSEMLAFDNSKIRVNAGANIQAAIPNQLISANFFATSGLALGGTTLIAQSDLDYIDDLISGAIPDPEFDENNVLSSVLATGILTTELGVSLAKKFTIAGHEVSLGASPKYQTVETIIYLAQISTFDENNFDADQYTVEESNFNVDLGVQTSFQNWQLGATLRNAIEYDYETVVTNRVIKISPQLTLGTAYKNEWLIIALDVDANAIEEPVTQQDMQFSRIGVEFDLFDWAQLRLGYRHDMKGTFDDTASLGLGFSPFGVLNIDIAGMAGENDTAGLAIQFGVSF